MVYLRILFMFFFILDIINDNNAPAKTTKWENNDVYFLISSYIINT